jgi:hypothetical protein
MGDMCLLCLIYQCSLYVRQRYWKVGDARREQVMNRRSLPAGAIPNNAGLFSLYGGSSVASTNLHFNLTLKLRVINDSEE